MLEKTGITQDFSNAVEQNKLKRKQMAIIIDFVHKMKDVIKKFQDTLPEEQRLSNSDIECITNIIYYKIQYEIDLGAGGHVTDLATIVSSALLDVRRNSDIKNETDEKYEDYIEGVETFTDSSDFLSQQRNSENFLEIYKAIPYIACFIRKETNGNVTLKASIGGKEIYSNENGVESEPHGMEDIRLVSQYDEDKYEQSVGDNENTLLNEWIKRHGTNGIMFYGN